MKTNDLIDMLAQENQAQTPQLRPLPLTVLAASGASLALLLTFWGLRPDVLQVIVEPLVLIKYVLPALTAAPCLWFASKARHPDTSLHGNMRWMALPLAIVAVLVLATLASQPSDTWLASVQGQTLFACLCSIPLLAAPILAALLWLMRGGASSEPALAGAFAGLASGSLATSVYALHCFEDSPAFYGLWYSAAIVLTGLIGQQLGKRLLKW